MLHPQSTFGLWHSSTLKLGNCPLSFLQKKRKRAKGDRYRAVGARGPGGPRGPWGPWGKTPQIQILTDQLTQSEPRGDYVHHITTCPPPLPPSWIFETSYGPEIDLGAILNLLYCQPAVPGSQKSLWYMVSLTCWVPC